MADGQFARTIAQMDGIFAEVEAARGAESSLSAKIGTKQDTLTVGTNLDGSLIAESTNPVTGGGVFRAIYGVYYTGTIQENDDLNNYTTPGRFRCSSNNASTIAHSPYKTGQYVMDVFYVYNSDRLIQRIWIGGARYFMRGYNGTVTPPTSPWNNWFEYAGTDTGISG